MVACVPFVEPGDMLRADPLPGWHGRLFHSQHMTFAYWDIDDGAAPLHEHFHPQEEVWHVVEGEVVLVIDGTEYVVTAGSAAVVPPDVPHAARPLGACRVVVADTPRRDQLPGLRRAPSDVG
jgi:mannose-6-phosphate isomerase-like protein (cupin superfamily)